MLALIENESGADRVEEILREEDVVLPWVALLEVHHVVSQRRGRAEADRCYALLSGIPAAVVWDASESVLLTAARFKAAHLLSLADAILGAYAKAAGAKLVHKDPEYEALAAELPMEPLPYK